jgi:hypothetical protein
LTVAIRGKTPAMALIEGVAEKSKSFAAFPQKEGLSFAAQLKELQMLLCA